MSNNEAQNKQEAQDMGKKNQSKQVAKPTFDEEDYLEEYDEYVDKAEGKMQTKKTSGGGGNIYSNAHVRKTMDNLTKKK